MGVKISTWAYHCGVTARFTFFLTTLSSRLGDGSKRGKRKRVKVALHSLRPARALSHVLLAGAVFFFVSFVFIMRKLNAWLELVGLHCDA
jgi:hypothetical protein